MSNLMQNDITSSADFLNHLNNDFGRFGAQNTTPAMRASPLGDDQGLSLDQRTLRKINPRKAAGPAQGVRGPAASCPERHI